MAEQFYVLITDVGLAKITNGLINNTKVDFTQMAVGDGGGSYYNPSSSQIKLVREVWRGPVGMVAIDEDDNNRVQIISPIPPNVGGFFIREVGLYDADGDLIIIAKQPETYKPAIENGSTKDLTIKLLIEVANASSIVMKIDPTVITATRKYVDDKVAEHYTKDTASTSKKGHVQLSDATNNASVILAATANAVKKVWDMATAKYSKPTAGIPKSDLTTAVQASLSKADSAVQDISGLAKLSDITSERVNALPTNSKLATDNPTDYNVGNFVFQLSGGINPEVIQGWLDSVGVDFGIVIGNLRARVEVTKYANITGYQEITFYNWSSSTGYRIYGTFQRASNFNTGWGSWRRLMDESGGQMAGILKAHPNTSYTVAQVRNVILSKVEPTDDMGNDGDVCHVYED